MNLLYFVIGFIFLMIHFVVLCIAFYSEGETLDVCSKDFWLQNIILFSFYMLCYVIGYILLEVLHIG